MAQTYFPNYGGYYGPAQPFQNPMGVMPSPTPAMAQAAAPTAQQASFTCRPVASREDAVAVQADFFSMGTVMPDLAHGTIYLKRINQQTGGAVFFEFVYRQPEAEPKPEYITRQEFDDFVKSLQPKRKAKQEVTEDE